MVNENSSCFSSLRVAGNRLRGQLGQEINPSNPIFSQSYRQPLRPLLHHLNTIKASEGIILRFSRVSLEICTGPSETETESSWRSLLEPVTIETPIYPPLEAFPVEISGLSSDWFHFLADAVGSSSLSSKSTLIMSTSQGRNVLKLILLISHLCV